MNILPALVNLTVAQGTTYRARFRSVSPSVPASFVNGVWIDKATGLPLDPSLVVPANLTGKSIRGAMRKKHADALPLIAFNETSNNVFLDAATGIYGIDFTPALTSPLKATDIDFATDETGVVILRASKYVFDIEIFDAVTGEVTRPINGQITLTAEVSK